MQLSELWNGTELFVIDIDGTFRHGTTVVPGAIDFINRLKSSGKKFLFFTNNSSKTPDYYVEELRVLGCELEANQVISTLDVVAHNYSKQNSTDLIYVVGSEEVCDFLRKKGMRIANGNWEEANSVLVTYDKEFTYEKLARACTLIQRGADFIATHTDVNCPVEGGFLPDCGAILASIICSCEKMPRVIGKPNRETLDMILDLAGVQEKQVTFIGDRLETDIAIGYDFGANTILVYGGASTPEDIERTKKYPTIECESLGDLYRRIEQDITCD